MDRCARCGSPIRVHRWLTHEIPVKKAGIQYLFTGYAVETFKKPICDRCSDEYEKFIAGEHVDDVTRFDECPNCGNGIVPVSGKRFCSRCGSLIEITEKKYGKYYPVTLLDSIKVVE